MQLSINVYASSWPIRGILRHEKKSLRRPLSIAKTSYPTNKRFLTCKESDLVRFFFLVRATSNPHLDCSILLNSARVIFLAQAKPTLPSYLERMYFDQFMNALRNKQWTFTFCLHYSVTMISNQETIKLCSLFVFLRWRHLREDFSKHIIQ
jgi:hypothetical protein